MTVSYALINVKLVKILSQIVFYVKGEIDFYGLKIIYVCNFSIIINPYSCKNGFFDNGIPDC